MELMEGSIRIQCKYSREELAKQQKADCYAERKGMKIAIRTVLFNRKSMIKKGKNSYAGYAGIVYS